MEQKVDTNNPVPNIYRSDEAFIAVLHLLYLLVPIFAWAVDKDYVGFFVLNPLTYCVLGLLAVLKRRVYVPNRTSSYFVIEGDAARQYGVVITMLGFSSAIIFNIFSNIASHYLWFIWVQLIVSGGAAIYHSIKYGERLDHGTPPRF